MGRSREEIRAALRRYAELYGPGFTAAAFSPSTAKWRDDSVSIERYYAGDPLTGEAWPSLNAIKAHYAGSFNAARVDAGLAANRPGPSRRRKQGEHAPVRGVSHVGATRTVRVPVRDPDDQAEIRRLRDRLASAQGRERDLRDQLRAARPAAPTSRTVTKTKTKTVRVPDRAGERRADRLESRLEREREQAKAALDAARAADADLRVELAEARQAASRAASKLERAEATVNEVRAERRGLRDAAGRAEDRADAAERMLAEVRAELDVERGRERVVMKAAPEQEILDGALADAQDARARQAEAERRAAHAERLHRQVAAAATGAERVLTPDEIRELASAGPAGPAMLATALKALAGARAAGGSGVELRAALRRVASAAVSWAERI